jgi:periplasmic divalent cation tolerance protein
VKLLVVLTTEANQAKAEALAAQLLEQHLAACIALQPQQSLYHWQGRIEQGSEVQLVIKTNAERLEALHQLHSYDVPEWIVLPGECSAAYGSWLSSSLNQPEPGDASAPTL